MTTVFIPLLLGSLLAGFIQGLSGFGFAVVAMSCWAWFLEPKTAAILTLYGGLLGQTISLSESIFTFFVYINLL